MSKKLKLEDLKVGMKVSMRQLSNIYNVFIYLSDTYFDDSIADTIGVISYIGNLSIEEAGFKIGTVCAIYNPSEEDSLDDFE